MQPMNSATVISINHKRQLARAIDARRTIEDNRRRRGGRAWVNGVELGGEREGLKHLHAAHD